MPTIVSMTLLMAFVCFFANESDKHAKLIKTAHGPEHKERLFLYVVVILLSLYAAMRTRGNDTRAYINGYRRMSITVRAFFSTGRWDSEKGPLFTLLEVVCKNYITDNYHVFFLIAAMITNGLILGFMRKFSPDTVIPVFLYITMSGFGCSMTGMRQELATAVAVWTVPLAMEKKWIRFILVLWISFRLHFATIIYVVSPFLLNKVWNKTTIIAVIGALLAGVFFSQFSQLLLDAGDAIGFENYDESILYGNSINVFRVLVFLVPPVLSFIFRRDIAKESQIIRCMANLSVVAFGFVFLGLFGKANTFGRFGILLEPAAYMVLPVIIRYIQNPRTRKVILSVMIIAFLIYYTFDHVKNGIGEDFYLMESVFDW